MKGNFYEICEGRYLRANIRLTLSRATLPSRTRRVTGNNESETKHTRFSIGGTDLATTGSESTDASYASEVVRSQFIPQTQFILENNPNEQQRL